MPTPTLRRSVRCGWCIDRDHTNCAVTIRMNNGDIWRCPCGCTTAEDSTRCVDCKRRNVEVTDRSECADNADCRAYRAARRAQDPAFQVIDAITRTQVEGTRPQGSRNGTIRRIAVDRTPPRPKEGQCLCCGEPTRGGKFRPGHDSRYVSEQAAAYLATGKDEAEAIYSKMEALGAALHAKWVKRVELLRAKETADA